MTIPRGIDRSALDGLADAIAGHLPAGYRAPYAEEVMEFLREIVKQMHDQGK